MVTEINLKIDKSILLALNQSKKDFTNDMLFNNASTLYRNEKLSLRKAAELTGYDTEISFIRKLQDESKQRLETDEITDYDFLEILQEALRL